MDKICTMEKTAWILLDNRIGSRHQAEGVADYLKKSNINIVNKEIEYTKLAILPNIIKGRSLLGIATSSRKNLVEPWPDIVISASRRTAPVARWIKNKNKKTNIFQLMHIGFWGIKDFSLIFVPEHDKNKCTASNIKYTTGSPHFITKEKLSEAYQVWYEKFKNLPHPITALIIGGAIKGRPFTIENAEQLAQDVKKIKQKEGGSLLITTSRRTGKTAEKSIMSYLEDIPQYSYLWGDKSENPYLGYLACADDLIVTGDSVSMCCEATATNKPLYIFAGKNWLTKKHLRFIHTLFNKGYASDLSHSNMKQERPQPLNVAKDIAEEILLNCNN